VKAGTAPIRGAALNLRVEEGCELRDYEYDKNRCVKAVKEFIEKYNSTSMELYSKVIHHPHVTTVLEHVGSWAEAVRLAGGLPLRNRSKNEVIKAFKQTIASLGYIPSPANYQKLNLSPSHMSLYKNGLTYSNAIQLIGLPYHFKRKRIPEGKRLCPMCGVLFSPNNGKQIYCSRKCLDRFKSWKYRVLRKMNKKCPRCGREMDYPISFHKKKKHLKYCSNCRLHFNLRYLKTKEDISTMATKSTSVNFQPHILEELAKRGPQRAPIVNRDLERLYTLYDRALRRVKLTVDEACLIVDALNGTLHDVTSGTRFWIGVQDSIEMDELDEKWGVDGKTLIEKLSKLDDLTAMAIVDAAERFWCDEKSGDDFRKAVAEHFGIG